MLLLINLLEKTFKLPSFLKERPFNLCFERGRRNHSSLKLMFFDTERDQLVFEYEMPEHCMFGLLQEYLGMSFKALGLAFSGNSWTLDKAKKDLTALQLKDYTYKEDYLNDQEAAFGRPQPPRPINELPPPGVVDEPLAGRFRITPIAVRDADGRERIRDRDTNRLVRIDYNHRGAPWVFIDEGPPVA